MEKFSKTGLNKMSLDKLSRLNPIWLDFFENLRAGVGREG